MNYNQGPTSVVGHPRHHAHAERGAFVLPNGTNGVTLPLPTSITENGPSFNAHYVSGNTHSDHYADGGVQDTNGRFTYHVAQGLERYVEGDTHPGELLYTRSLPDNDRYENMRERSYDLKGHSELARAMQHDKHNRDTFGSELSVRRMKKEWAYSGVLQTDPSRIGSSNGWNSSVTLIKKGRARMPNIWLAQSRGRGTQASIGELAVLYIVWRRRLYRGDYATSEATWDPTLVSSNAASRREQRKAQEGKSDVRTNLWVSETDEERSKRVVPGDQLARSMTSLVCNLVSTKVDTTDPLAFKERVVPKAKEYYWSPEPYVSYDGSPPPPALYTGDPRGDPDNQFIGDYDAIGQIVHISRGPNNRTPQQIKLARDVIHKDERNTDAWASMHKLDEIEVHLGVGLKYN